MSRRYTESTLKPIIDQSKSWAEVCRRFGVKPNTGSQYHISNVAKKMNIDFSHFTGQGWSKGKKFPPRLPIEEYLKKNKWASSDRLKKRLIKEGIKENKCEECGLSEWRGKELPLELDHINGDHDDNRLENLKISCPNCHAVKTRKERRSLGEIADALRLGRSEETHEGATPSESTKPL